MPSRWKPAAERRAERESDAAELRRVVLWGAAVFVACGVIGLAVAPGLKLVWAVMLLFGIAAIPQAFSRNW